jgi:hypothetical protein
VAGAAVHSALLSKPPLRHQQFKFIANQLFGLHTDYIPQGVPASDIGHCRESICRAVARSGALLNGSGDSKGSACSLKAQLKIC